MTKAAELAKMGEVLTNSQIGGRRNIIINGAMQVAQRGTSSTGIGGSAGYFTLDRWQISPNGTDGRLTMTQDSSAPSGFANSTKLACTTADTSIAAGEFLTFTQKIEGQDLQAFAKGTSDAKTFAVSFYVKGNANVTYVAELMDNDNSNRHVSKSFSVTTDWTRVELSFPADTTGAFDDDNADSMVLNIWLHAGTNFTSGSLQTTWGALSQTSRAVGISSFFSSTSNTFFITGVQLEVGKTTPFEHRSFGEELNLARRYYYQPDLALRMISMLLRPDNKRQFQHFFPVQMRADPTATTTYDADGSSATLTSPIVSKDQFRARTDALNATTQDPRLTAFKMDAEL
tara:strand:+ start:394 stop:1425 length:1032 start_codon:yes stop_codon:yes gene_type:complete